MLKGKGKARAKKLHKKKIKTKIHNTKLISLPKNYANDHRDQSCFEDELNGHERRTLGRLSMCLQRR